MNPIRRLDKSLVTFLGAAALLVGCSHPDKVIVVQPAPAPQPQTVVVHDNAQTPQTNTIIVHDAPPPARDETVPSEPPSAEMVWAPGHWEYQDNNYTWVAGTWIAKPQPTAEYVPPHWENRPEGWAYVPGYWK
jgi:hypothetical protein